MGGKSADLGDTTGCVCVWNVMPLVLLAKWCVSNSNHYSWLDGFFFSGIKFMMLHSRHLGFPLGTTWLYDQK